MQFDLPGVEASSIDLTVEKNVLTVHAQRQRSSDDGTELLVAERPHGTFSRQLFLGETLDTDRIDAAYANGVLTLRVPVAERAKPRRVTIASGDDARRVHRVPGRGVGRGRGLSHVHPLDDEHAPRFAVGQVAEMLDVQPAFVRRLDTERVVQPARSDGGQRRYSRADIDQVQRVAEMADEGMTLVGIRRIFELELELEEVRAQLARAKARLGRREDHA